MSKTSKDSMMSDPKKRLQDMLAREKKQNQLSILAFILVGGMAFYWMTVIYGKTMSALKPEQIMEVIQYRITEKIPEINQQLKEWAPQMVGSLYDQLLTGIPSALKGKIVESAKPMIDEAAGIVSKNLKKNIHDIAQVSADLTKNPAKVRKDYAAIFEMLAIEAENSISLFYKESTPVLRAMLHDIDTLKNETNLTRREELTKKIIGLILAMIDKQKMTAANTN